MFINKLKPELGERFISNVRKLGETHTIEEVAERLMFSISQMKEIQRQYGIYFFSKNKRLYDNLPQLTSSEKKSFEFKIFSNGKQVNVVKTPKQEAIKTEVKSEQIIDPKPANKVVNIEINSKGKTIQSIKRLTKQGFTKDEIAKKINRSPETIRKVARENKIKLCGVAEMVIKFDKQTIERIKILTKTNTPTEIAKYFGKKYTAMQIRNVCYRNGIGFYTDAELRVVKIQELLNQGKSIEDILEATGFTKKTVNFIIKANNLKANTSIYQKIKNILLNK